MSFFCHDSIVLSSKIIIKDPNTNEKASKFWLLQLSRQIPRGLHKEKLPTSDADDDEGEKFPEANILIELSFLLFTKHQRAKLILSKTNSPNLSIDEKARDLKLQEFSITQLTNERHISCVIDWLT